MSEPAAADGAEHQRVSPWWWLAAIPVIYLGFFAVALGDALWFDGHLLHVNHWPMPMRNFLEAIYAPLVWLVERMHLLD